MCIGAVFLYAQFVQKVILKEVYLKNYFTE